MDESITKSTDVIPDASDLRDAYNLELRSADGKPVRLGELILDKGDHITSIIVFVRHFFCAYDQDYVRSVCHHLSESVLKTLPHTDAPIQLIIIGCGNPSLIVPYVAETGTAFPVYSDPSGRLYKRLHMRRTVQNIMRPPSYTKISFWKSMRIAMKQMMKQGKNAFKGGKWGQNGGEWVFKGRKCEYAHRMEHVSDHLTAEELLKILECREGRGSVDCDKQFEE
ncbi:AhpC/TSA antioxidant enzyme-domain-containing protein [Aspergillus karnatakaensis]|uniref:peroxiredoxin-like family protein n=1 Tax=Aspergillus karnatakaensis TaxID=1810916 RepID=UPI003CCD5097